MRLFYYFILLFIIFFLLHSLLIYQLFYNSITDNNDDNDDDKNKNDFYDNHFLTYQEYEDHATLMSKIFFHKYSHNSLPYPLLFIHIAKTGGTTLINALKSSNIPFYHFWRAPNKEIGYNTVNNLIEIQNKGILGGHVVWGMHRCWNPPLKKYTYFTILRNPISRVISHYRYHLNPSDPNHYRTQNKTFIEWMETVKYGQNAMTAYLAGIEYSAWWNEDYFELLPPTGDNPLFKITSTHYVRARTNLINSIIGLQEEFSESMEQFSYFFNINISETRHDNVGTKKSFNPTDKEIEEIKRLNNWDIKLYELGKYLFEKQSQVYSNLLLGNEK